MNIESILQKYYDQMRRRITYPDMVREESENIVRYIRPAPGRSVILFSALTSENADAEIESQIADLTARHLPFDWKAYSYDSPADLVDRLKRHGFTPDPRGALMVLDLAEAPAELLTPVRSDVRKVGAEHLEEVIQVLESVWGGDFNWVQDRLGSHLRIPGYLSIFLAYDADQPVSVGWTYFHPDNEFASLWGGSTLPSYRGKGFYFAVLAARVQEAIARGKHYLVVDAGEMSWPIVERHGFVQLADIFDCEYSGSFIVE